MLLITRPQPEADALQQRLHAINIACLVQPLLDIRFLDAELPATPPQALLATSANGVRALVRVTHGARHGHDPRRIAPLLAIGAATARQARQAGFAPVWSANGDAESLLALAERHCRKQAGELLHLCGRHVAVDIAGQLRQRGFSARRLVLYEAVAATSLDAAVADALRHERIDGVLLYSRRTAQVWEALLHAAGLQEHCRAMTAYCLAPSAAEAADALPFRRIVSAPRPDEEALLALLPGASEARLAHSRPKE